jgi:hypothetical protein
LKRLLVTLLTALAACVGYVAPASADLLYTFNFSGCCGSGPFGTVLLHQTVANSVEVTVSLNADVGFVNTGLEPFAFTLAGGLPALTGGSFSGLTGGFSLDPNTGFNDDGAGAFQYGLLCTTAVCGTGGGAPFMGPLHFILTDTGLTEASFIANSSGNFFAIDMCFAWPDHTLSCNDQTPPGKTGAAWAKTPGTPPQAPEPGILSLLAIAVLGFGFTTMRRRTV